MAAGHAFLIFIGVLVILATLALHYSNHSHGGNHD